MLNETEVIENENLQSIKQKETITIEGYEKSITNRKKWGNLWKFLAPISILGLFYLGSNPVPNSAMYYILSISCLVISLFGLIIVTTNNESDEKEKSNSYYRLALIEDKLFANEITNMTKEERAVRQLTKSQVDLDRYYQLSLNHVNKIFNIGKIIIFFGTTIILFTLLFLILNPESINVTLMIMSFVSGILIDFTGALFIYIYSKTIKSANMNQYGMLETNQVYLGNVLVSQIENESLREETLSALAKELVGKEKKINFIDSE